MQSLIPYIWIAGGIQVALASANFSIRARVNYQVNTSRITPIMRQISIVHWAYIACLLVVSGVLSFLFAPEITSGSPIGTFLSAGISLFWYSRLATQLFYFDQTLRRQNRLADAFFLMSFGYMGSVFGAAALGGCL